MALIRYMYNQSAGLRAGIDLPKDILIDVPAAQLSPDLRDRLAQTPVQADGARAIRTGTVNLGSYTDGMGVPGEPILSSEAAEVLAGLEERLRVFLDARAAEKALQQRLAAMDEEEFARATIRESTYRADLGWDAVPDLPLDAALKEKRDAVLRARRATVKTEREAEAAQVAARDRTVKEEEKRQEKARNALRALWVKQHGTPSQRARLAASTNPLGMLPPDEVDQAMRNALFAPLEGFARYERIRPEWVGIYCPRADEDAKKDVTFTIEDASTATEDQFDLLQAISEAVKQIAWKGHDIKTNATLRRHVGSWDCGDDAHPYHTLARLAVRVKVILDGVTTFSREYKASDSIAG